MQGVKSVIQHKRIIIQNSVQSDVLLTWCLDVQPARPFNLPAEEEVLQTRSVGSKNVGEGRPLKVRRQRRELSLQEQNLPHRLSFLMLKALTTSTKQLHTVGCMCARLLTEYLTSRYSH